MMIDDIFNKYLLLNMRDWNQSCFLFLSDCNRWMRLQLAQWIHFLVNLCEQKTKVAPLLQGNFWRFPSKTTPSFRREIRLKVRLTPPRVVWSRGRSPLKMPGRLNAGTYSHHPFRKEHDLNQTSRIMFHPKNPCDVKGCQKHLFWGPRGVTRRVWCFHRRGQDP